jgi:uncharacterized protein YdeI (YjbR/CyaY-like superfamily)
MNLLHLTTRESWRAWLAENHGHVTEIWLVYSKRHTGLPRVEYDDAVEEALCFGWIDSIVRSLDDDRYAQKFTPRKAKSKWSDLNRRRFAKMVAEGRMTAVGLARSPSPEEAPKASARDWDTVPPYIEDALRENGAAWESFSRLAPSHRREYVGWIDSAKKEETRQRRLAEAVSRLERNEKLGMK